MKFHEVGFLSALLPAVQTGDAEGEAHAGLLFHGAQLWLPRISLKE